jgi:hypothetical protein
LADKQHRLAALRIFGESMEKLEQLRQQGIANSYDPAVVDRVTAQQALNGVVLLCLEVGIESSPLARLLTGIEALSSGSRPPAMLAPAATRHRRKDAPGIEGIKGELAAIMEFRQQAGLTRKAAATWVARHIPATLKRQLGLTTSATVDSWLVKWGGNRGTTSGAGRDGYLHMRARLKSLRPTERHLDKILTVLSKSLPS